MNHPRFHQLCAISKKTNQGVLAAQKKTREAQRFESHFKWSMRMSKDRFRESSRSQKLADYGSHWVDGVPQVWPTNSTLWLFNIAMENGPFIDGLPIKNGDFPWLC